MNIIHTKRMKNHAVSMNASPTKRAAIIKSRFVIVNLDFADGQLFRNVRHVATAQGFQPGIKRLLERVIAGGIAGSDGLKLSAGCDVHVVSADGDVACVGHGSFLRF